ncbi:hypothetical protein LG047_18265 [Methylocystis sp. WRRC1]|uniref:hypothetical protein n=1 Tax=Methylocystis sp. WRRC1 TaxID=1732014 RepID=UPI001D14C9A7|nr:hypothetical protein [Methylocystis sp. WRRC1]MCC3247237.1 hypothetical protein [Methylocystis sp. WRRC1]
MFSGRRFRAALALAFAAVTTTAMAAQPGAQGIRGLVTLGPRCGAESFPPEPGCAERKFAASLIVERVAGSRRSWRFSSNAEGRFEIALPPGRYQIRSTTILPRCQSNEPIVVAPGAFTEITIRCDSGVR